MNETRHPRCGEVLGTLAPEFERLKSEPRMSGDLKKSSS